MHSIKSFSICTIITDWDQYSKLNESLLEGGFNETNSEFINVDNSNGNRMDAYDAIRHFIKVSNNEFLILVHQDVLFPSGGYDKLNKIIEEISLIDPHWAVLANAGKCCDPLSGHIAVGDGIRKWHSKNFMAIVYSVDEHFIVLKKSSGVTVSRDIDGFHFYGTELCQVANRLGYKCYAVDFMLTHLSHGNINEDFFDAKIKIELKYKTLRKNRRIPTMCTCISVNSSYYNKTISDLYSYAIVCNSPWHLKSCNILKNNSQYTTLVARLIIKTGLIELAFTLKKFIRRIKGDVKWWVANLRSRIPL
jgi:hypothetical protein